MTAAILFTTFAILLLIGTPIAVCLGVSSVAAMLVQGAGRPVVTIMSSLPQLFAASTSKFVLLAIPFFILAGNIMERAQISRKLIRLAETCVGHTKGVLPLSVWWWPASSRPFPDPDPQPLRPSGWC